MDPVEAADIKRHFDVVAESLRADIRVLAEGLSSLDERFDGLEERMDRRFEETHSLIRLSYADLDGRLRKLESP